MTSLSPSLGRSAFTAFLVLRRKVQDSPHWLALFQETAESQSLIKSVRVMPEIKPTRLLTPFELVRTEAAFSVCLIP